MSASLAAGLAGLSPKQRAVLEARLRSRRAQAAGDAPGAVPRRGGSEPAPLSFAQQRLWFLDQLEPGSSAYNLPVAVRLAGDLDVAALAAAFGEVVRRHETLRTTFSSGTSGEPVQVVSPPLTRRPLPLADLSGLDGERAGAEAHRLVGEASRRAFDLAAGPLFRTILLRLGLRDHLLAAGLHHTVGDGWSQGLLLAEVGALYAAFRSGRPSPLPELPIQYGDWAVWQRQSLSGEALETELAHWRERLRGMPPQLELPADRPRPAASAASTSRNGSLPFALSEPTAEALRSLAADGGATLFMVLLAGFEALLAHFSGQEDFGVGTPVAGRTRPETESLIGFFANTLVLRADVAGDPTSADLIGRVRAATLDAYAHQEVPFDKLVEELEPERSLARTPLFQVMFVLHNAPTLDQRAFAVPGLRLTPLDFQAGQAKFDLHLSVVEVEGRLTGLLELDTERFDLATGGRVLERFQALLDAMAAAPDRPLSALPRLPEAERHQILTEWGATGRAYPAATIPELFRRRAAEQPEAVALVFEGESLSYGRLARRVHGLAQRLKELGVGPEQPVGVVQERSLELVIGLLAVLDAGGAYVPLDPDSPDERLARLLADTAPRVVLSTAEHRPRFADFAGAVLLDEARPEADPSAWKHTGIDGDSLAYVIFTSGSTGTPKGVMNTHAAIANRLLWMQEAYGLAPSDRVLQKTPFTFDVSVWEFFWPLITGATLVVARPEGHRDPDYLLSTIAEHGVTTLHFVPSMLQAFLDEPGLERAASLVRVFASGEALPGPLAAAFAERLPGVALHNLYGPTEAAVDVTFHPCSPEDASGVVPIGRPIANLEILIFDRHGSPVPTGTPGELQIGGIGLARGYLGRPDLTAERFVPRPGGGRLYRTGDLARHRPDGVIEFLGRIDHQVKIRGFRVEPGEIEAALREHPDVREAVVAARGAGAERRLVAYVVPSGEEPSAERLRQALRGRLPAYMVPEQWVFLAELPLTSSGKVDRKALPEPGPQTAHSHRGGGPLDPLEETLAAVWSDVLGVAYVDAHDDFFALGGHSLLATQVRSRVRHLLGAELPLRTFFEAPTLAGLAARVRTALRGTHRPEIPPLRAEPSSIAPLSFAQQRLWFLDQLDPGSAAYNLASAVRLLGALDAAALEASLAEIVRRHGALRTVFSRLGAEPVQEVRPAGGFVLPLVDLSGLCEGGPEIEMRRLAGAEARRPFDLSRGPLFRSLLVRCRPDEHLLAITLHHTVGDGWSMEVLERELALLYSGRAADLPEPPVQYTDFARWQRGWLTGEALSAEMEHWRLELAGMPPLLDLPTDRPRPPVQSFAGASRPVVLTGALATALRDLSRREGATLFMALLAGLQTVLARLSGQESLAVGTAIAGRSQVELEGLIGFFANTLVLRGDLHGHPSFRAMLGRARRRTLDAYAHQDIPFEKLVEELAPERSLAHTPLFQVMFAFQNAAAPRSLTIPHSLALPRLALEPLSLGGDTAKFDLTLLLAETSAGLEGKLEHALDLFDDPTVDRLAGHLATLLEAAAAEPDRPIHELPLITVAERTQIVAEWNDTAAAYDESVSLYELFERQAARTPDAPAVLDGRDELTYGELRGRAERIARRLAALGAGPGSLVAVCLDRSAAMPAALLGILRVGAAYVPLDAGWPASRAAWILARLGIRHLVTEGPRLAVLASALGETKVTEIVRLDPSGPPVDLPEPVRVWGPLDGTDGLDGPGAGADDLAYIIFTSGTTGTPKGVMVRHRPVVNLIEWVNRSFAVGPEDRVLFLTSLCFDLSVYDVFGLLAAGGSIRVAADAEIRDPQALVSLLLSEPVTFWDSAPAALQQLVPFLPDQPGPGSGHLRLAFLSGDWIPVTLPDRLRRAFPQVRPIALGGATEATVWSNSHPVRAVDPDWPSIPYGRPMQNARYHVLDGGLAPCPVRVAGDLYIGGDCLSAGYWGEPELTAEKFIPDLFSSRPGDRLYRTGDRARHWPDGTLEFLGRLDHQVKIRGFRIELGEIEAALGRHPAVREAAVLAPWGADGHRLLVAYVVARSSAPPSPAELRDHLGRQLPEPMVPSAFVFLDALPVTANGKLDRKALPAPDFEADAGELRLPRTPLEELLAGLWAEILGLPAVGVDQSFFDLGGHSLLATQLASRIQQSLGVELPLRRLFEQPTVAGLAASLALADSGEDTAPPLVPVPRSPESVLPLSFAQERLWFLHQIQPRDASYNVAAAVRLRGDLDRPAFDAALDEIARRHEVLRTSFALRGSRPAQVVAPSLSLAPSLVDLTSLPDACRQEETARQMRLEGAQPFQLARGPLVRTRLLKLGEDEHVVLLTLHHSISDAWSMGIVVQELAALYGAFLRRLPSPLAPLPVQYADFAAWQRSWLAGPVLDRQVAWWRERLADAPARLDLPSDRPRPAVQTFRGARRAWQLSPALSADLDRFGRQRGATLFMVLLAGYSAVLSRSSGQSTVVVGVPHANRNRIETEGLIGAFANTLALSLDLADDPSGGELLARSREGVLGAHAHQDLPFEKLVEELRPERSLAHSPIFQVMLNVQNMPARRVELPGLTLDSLTVEGEASKHELTLELTPGTAGLSGVWEHNTDLFDPSTIDRLAGHFQSLLSGLIALPELPVSELPLLSAVERAELAAWNATAVPYDLERPLHAWIEDAAARSPEATAVEGEQESLTYRELLDRSGRLARHLLDLGVGRDALVGVAAERSPELLVGLLGVLRSGAAYVPLDPDYPAERLDFMLRDSGVRVLLTQKHLRDALPAGDATVVELDPGAAWHHGPDLSSADRAADPEAAAYMIYTSGSTGQPKGAVNTHRGIVNRLLWMQETFGLTPDDRVLQKTPVSFDVSVWELFWPLMTGARLVLARPGGHQDPAYLAERIRSTGITTVHFVPSMLQAFLETPAAASCTSLRRVIASGEALSGGLARRSSEVFGESGAKLYNLYGPTEAAVDVTWWPAEAESGARPVPIGLPVANTRIVLCDLQGREVPVGVSGELCIGGVQLARGYWRRPELTAERFVPDGCGGAPGERLYRTGDLARRLPDGAIEYCGRLDHQIKLRGFRIELGEVEAALAACPEVKEAVVGARGQGTALRLVAWVTPAAGREIEAASLRTQLRSRLPEFMVPSAFVVLPALPLSPNGKVQRKALPDPERPSAPGGGEPPGTSLERELAALWSAVLGFERGFERGVERVGRTDNFFDLGGHSLLLVELQGRLRDQLGREVSMLDLLRHTTIKSLAEHLGGDGAARAVPARSLERREEIASGKERLRQRLGQRRS